MTIRKHFPAYFQLGSLTFAHFTADMYGGFLPSLLPALRERYGLTLTAGVILITALGLTANLVQVLTGHWRGTSERPLLIHLGLLLAASACLIGFCGGLDSPFTGLLVLSLAAGVGIALAHPEGLRALHAIEDLPAALGTAVFLVAGYFGYAAGSWIAAVIVERLGLQGLWILAAPSVAAVALVVLSKAKLAVDKERSEEKPPPRIGAPVDAVPFWPLAVAATPLVTGTLILGALLPSHLNNLGFSLKYGGLANLAFGGSGAIGALLMSSLAHRWGYTRVSLVGLALGAPLVAAYLAVCGAPWALVLLMASGICVGGVFPLLVTLSRYATGPALGRRMGVIVGGTWGTANFLLIGLGPIAERIGIGPVLHLAWICFVATALTLWLLDIAPRK